MRWCEEFGLLEAVARCLGRGKLRGARRRQGKPSGLECSGVQSVDTEGQGIRRRIGPPSGGSNEYRRAVADNWHTIGLPSLALSEIETAGILLPDLDAVRRYRLDRVRSQLQDLDYVGVILYDPVHIRYASDTTNMSVWTSHNPCRYLWVGAQGPTILFDYKGADFLAGHSSVVDEVRPATLWMYAPTGARMDPNLKLWSAELADLVYEHGGGNVRVAIDRASPDAIHALGNRGLQLYNGDEVMELARSIKSPEEITLMKAVMVATEHALDAMRSAFEPGMTELELWAVLHAENIVRGGEWIETRLLCSGPRTNPWYQEASARVIEDGDLVSCPSNSSRFVVGLW